MWNPDPQKGLHHLDDNDSFAYVGSLLWEAGEFSPRIYHRGRAPGCFLLEDLGDVSLQELVRGKDKEEQVRLYRRVLRDLAAMVREITPRFSPAAVHNPEYTAPFMREWESGYFVQRCLPLFHGLQWDDTRLAGELDRLAEEAEKSSEQVFIIRDFQSRNIMYHGARFRYIDFQGARLGPLTYDPASLLLDPYVELDPALQEELWEFYSRLLPGSGDRRRENYQLVALHRNLQALGAYGFLSTVKGKVEFRRYLPAGARALWRRLEHPVFRKYPELRRVAEQLVEATA
jgi:aminoglycoside/choline kinase family phosphotransferase